MTVEDLFDLSAEITLHLKDDSADALFRVMRFEGQNLLGIGEHAARTFSTAHSPENRNAGEQSTLGNHKPLRGFGGTRPAGVVDLAEDDEQIFSASRIGVTRKLPRDNA